MPIAYNLSSARAPAVLVDTVLVTISDGWCFHRDDNDMNGCISHPTEARHYLSLAISVTPHGEMHKTIPARVLNCCEEFIRLSTVCFGLGSLAAFVLTAAWRQACAQNSFTTHLKKGDTNQRQASHDPKSSRHPLFLSP
eukprot:31471-Pelagococcus_subviridis.AAC.8